MNSTLVGWDPKVGKITLTKLAIITILILASASLVAAAPPPEHEPPIPNGWLAPEMSPAPGPLPTQALALVQRYHLAAVVLWLTGASFAAGVVVGIAAHKRAGLWAVLVVAAFLGLVLGMGSQPDPALLFRPMIVLGGCLILLAAATGGWIGQSLWSAMRRVPAPPPGPDANPGGR